MEQSILTSTKKILGLTEDYTAFDLDILTHINAAFAVVNQLGVGPVAGFTIQDDTVEWEALAIPEPQLSVVKAYVYLKTRMLFDPPATSFHIDAANEQLRQFEWRLTTMGDEHTQVVIEEVVP